MLCLLFAQATLAIRATSLTIDEGLHITSGYSILRTGDYRLVEEHPPLLKLWFALPLLPLRELADPATLPAWQEAAHPTTESLPLLNMTRQLLYPHLPFERWLFPARIMAALLGVLLGAVVWRWAADLRGPRAGLLTLTLLVFDPNILAHAAVAGTDLGAACCMTLALFCLARCIRRPTHTRLLLAGITLGLAQGAKLSALLLIPISVAILLLTLPKYKLRATALYLLCAGVTLWTLYGFQIGAVPGLPFPVPAASHAIPWLRLREHTAGGHAAYLLGQNSLHGWWYYFPVAFALKTPLPILLLGLYGLMRTTYCILRNLLAKQPFILHLTPHASRLTLYLFPLLYAAASLASTLNIGYRHLLPMLPFLYIGIANSGWRSKHHVSRFTQYALLAWLMLGTLRIAPHYLAYFNELAGGTDNGWRFLADSNTDWGQAYKDLARFQAEQGVGTVQLSAFIFYDPAVYGVDYTPLTPLRGDTPAIFPSRLNPPPGDYVISATTLAGIPLVDPEMYDWFRKRAPNAKIGQVLFYYHIPEPDTAADWLAQCVLPVAPLTSKVAHEGLGQAALRLIYFDCTQTWVYPGAGESTGWYAHYLSQDALNAFAQEQLAFTRLAYEQHTPHATPPFALYAWDRRSQTTPLQTINTDAVKLLPAGHPPAAAETTLTLPLELAGPLTFLGYQFEGPPTQPPVLRTYWKVTATTTRPFSIMAHILNDAGQLLATGDGLGIAADMLLPGDLLIQRHVFTTETFLDTETSRFQLGAYWLDSLERWAIITAEEHSETQFILTKNK